MTTEQSPSATLHSGDIEHDWREAGAGWGHAANDWSCLFEHYALEVIAAIFGGLGVGPDVSVLDIACGSGLAVRHAHATGAEVAGLDASAELIAIARARTPQADLRVGTMYELPWNDSTFDTAVSINGVWGGCEAALHEAHRVLRSDGMLGISFWGTGPPLDLREVFKSFAFHAPTQHLGSMRSLNSISAPGVAEQMLEANGFDVVERGRRISTVEWPDADVAWRAVSSVGPAVPAMRNGDVGVDAIRREVMGALESCRDERGIYRFRNDHQFVIARRSDHPLVHVPSAPTAGQESE